MITTLLWSELKNIDTEGYEKGQVYRDSPRSFKTLKLEIIRAIGEIKWLTLVLKKYIQLQFL